MNHYRSVFANSCLKIPVDPITKMPKTAYERRKQRLGNEQCSIESSSTCSLVIPPADAEAEKVKSFYRSIPDYTDINHLPEDEFYSTLKSLREKKKIVFGATIEHIDYDNGIDYRNTAMTKDNTFVLDVNKNIKCRINYPKCNSAITTNENANKTPILESFKVPSIKPTRKLSITDINSSVTDAKKSNLVKTSSKINNDRPKRNHSACSISWNDANIETRNEINEKFDKFFENEKVDRYLSRESIDDDFRTKSMPSSPLRSQRYSSPISKKRITIPKPFKMTERDEDERVVNELRGLQKSYSDDMLHRKCERKQFRARPVPVESRIPLYDRILEDQAMRRAICKINSEAELRAQMKPFSFTKREEKGQAQCDRAVLALPKSKKKKRFKARPIPKNLFSNYFYDKLKEDNYFKTMNRRIRAEEMLRSSHAPVSLTAKDRSRLSTPAAHSDLPTDPSPAAPSVSSSDRQRSVSPSKERRKKRDKIPKEFISTTPQPFRFNTADRAAKKTEEVARKLYQDSKSTESTAGSGLGIPRNESRALSALELRATATGRSNLAALLRAEAVRQKFEMEAARKHEEHRKRLESKHRDRFLRSNPAWHLVKNNHEEDIAIRLQTRRDEERLRREEFLHEMELMYGRVQQQPMLFERYYAPRPYAETVDSIQLSPRKSPQKGRKKAYHSSPNRSRKVSINDNADFYKAANYLNDRHDKFSDSDVLDSLDRCK